MKKKFAHEDTTLFGFVFHRIYTIISRGLIFMLILLSSLTAFSQQKITFTWNGSTEPKTVSIKATEGTENIVVNWGDGINTAEKFDGHGTNTLTYLTSPAYENTNNYNVIITTDDGTIIYEFACNEKQVSVLDVSNNTALTHLNCFFNQLTSLDVSNNTALTYLHCYNNQLASLDVSNNTALTRLQCSNNPLTSLDVSNNTALTDLTCSSNQLTSIDVSNNTALTYLHCYNNQLTSLDVSNNTALTNLQCQHNQLISLDVSNNTALTSLACYNNQLTSLDVSNNTALTYLHCSNNQLTSLDVSNNTALTSLSCQGNQLTSLDLRQNTILKHLQCQENQLTSLEISATKVWSQFHCYSNSISFAGLKDISDKTMELDKYYKHFGTQTLATQAIATTSMVIDSVFYGAGTTFTPVLYNGTNVTGLNTYYTITNGEITFMKSGLYSIEMMNPTKLLSNLPAKVIASYDVMLPSKDATLSNLTVSEGTLDPSFASGTFEYNVTVPYATTSFNITAIATHSNASVSGDIGSQSIVVGDNLFTITVTAEDNSFTQDYIITVLRQSNDATLSNLTVSHGSLNPSFASETFEYDVTVPYATTSFNITAIATHSNASVSGDIGSLSIVVGDNLFTITVTAEDPSYTQNYVITVYRKSNDATLATLNVNPGTLTPSFVAETTDYTVDVDKDTFTIAITASTTHNNATLVGTGTKALATGENSFEIIVTAEDNNYTQTYTIVVTRAPYLITASASEGGSINPSGVIEVNVGTMQSFNITADEGYIIDQVLIDGIYDITATFTGQYTFRDVYANHTIAASFRAYSNDATLASLTVSEGELSPTFSSNTLNYNVSVPNEISSIEVIGIATHLGAIIHSNGVFDLRMGETIIPILVIAEDGITQLKYRITVYRASDGSDDAFLKDLRVNHGKLKPFFNKNITIYHVNVHLDIDAITISATANSSMSTVNGTGEKQLVEGENSFTVTVSAHNGTTKDYTLHVYRGPQYRITANVDGKGGMISEEGILEFYDGDTQTFTMTPDDGYMISQVFVDGSDVGSIDTYTFADITSNHTITVKFMATVGIETLETTEMKLYPNPTTDYIVIESEKEINNVTVFNSAGKRIFENKNIGAKTLKLDFNSYASGVYFIDIDGKMEKVVKM